MSNQIMRALTSERGIIIQLQWYLFIYRIYMPCKRQYERQFQAHNDDHHNKLNQRRPSLVWHFPEYPMIFKVYNVIASTILSWVIVKYLFPGVAIEVGGFLWKSTGLDWGQTSLASSCYAFGRLVLHYEISAEFFGFLFASYPLIFRVAQLALDRPFILDPVLFLMQPKKNIERFISKLVTSSTSSEKMTDYELFLSNIMCYKLIYASYGCNHDQKDAYDRWILYKLRPNRTLEARERLIHRLAWTTINSCLATLLCGLIITTYFTLVILFNQRRYLDAYPGCDSALMEQFIVGNLSTWSRPRATGRPHYVASVVIDWIENFFVWGDCGAVMTFGLLFAIYLNGDLLDYWHHLRMKLGSLLGRSKLLQVTPIDEQFPVMDGRVGRVHDEEREIYELQAELCDFFHQIKRVDLLLSDVLTDELFIWISLFASSTFLATQVYLSSNNTNFAILCSFLSSTALPGFCLTSVLMLSLQRNCKLSYVHICSLMAHDQSRYKRHFMRIIDFYTSANRTCYTVLQIFPFSSSNFVSIVGWSVSIFLLVDSVFQRSQ